MTKGGCSAMEGSPQYVSDEVPAQHSTGHRPAAGTR
jgi:hypothetical protein